MGTLPRFAIHWFRRDLRIRNNPSLNSLIDRYEGRVLGLFCFDSAFLARPDFSANRFAFFLASLRDLKAQMEDRSGQLLVLDRRPLDAFEGVLKECGAQAKPAEVGFNRDYEPFARERDRAVTKLLSEKHAVTVSSQRDHLVLEPDEILAGLDRGPYQVFSPFQRRWTEVYRGRVRDAGAEAVVLQCKDETAARFRMRWQDVAPKLAAQDALEEFAKKNDKHVSIPIPKAGAKAAFAKVDEFEGRIGDYAKKRDVPSVKGTSQFSIYFKNGSLTVGEAIHRLKLRTFAPKPASSRDKFLSELIWREFYYHVLHHFPHVERSAFQPKYDRLKWENDNKKFEAWKQGRTGYPIVDAGMRQLNQTGWMHNRVRMIVASFLTKDLLIDWRWGERYFMEKLLDGDLAPNNGGWQWAASTGCDPQPYFRIFNPYLQSRKFDPDGQYIRHFIPELAKVSSKLIHEPGAANGYPPPIVDHRLQRDRALLMYGKARE